MCKKFSLLKFPLSQVQKKFYFKEEPAHEGFFLYMGFNFGKRQKIVLRHWSGCGFYQAWHPVANGVVSPRSRHAHHIHSIRVWHNKFLQWHDHLFCIDFLHTWVCTSRDVSIRVFVVFYVYLTGFEFTYGVQLVRSLILYLLQSNTGSNWMTRSEVHGTRTEKEEVSAPFA